MPQWLRQALDHRRPGQPTQLGRLYTFLVLCNLAAWVAAIYVFHDRPVLLGTALLAYGFGLRHAVDADHIAAIDNVTRKLVQAGQRPLTVGFWFAVGHSAVVMLASLAIALTGTALASRFGLLQSVGGIVGTLVSTFFLLVIAAINLLTLAGIWRALRKARRGEPATDHAGAQGILSRLFHPLFRLITQSWHMLPLGFLFGLGFDTATEIALLGISATQAEQGMSIWAIMLFPALFTAGMALIDTTDGVLMLGAYNWAFINPIRKLRYNLAITGLSVLVAVLVGGIEGLGLIGDQLGLEGWFWNGISTLNDNFNAIGFAIIGLFILAWVVSLIFYRYAPINDSNTISD